MKISNFLVLFLFVSCSALETNNEESTKPKIYSSETEKYFESIEKTQVGELYEKNSNRPNDSTNIHKNNEYERGSLTSIKKPHALVVKEVKLKGHSQLKRELNQILSFHCMKHRKRFKSEGQCIEAVNLAIVSCEKNHQEVKPPFVKCLKSKLKNI